MNRVKSFKEFIGESIWSDLQDRSSGEVIKKENGMVIGETEDGQRIVIGNDAYADGKIVQFDGETILRFGDNLYVAVVSDGDTDVFYAFDSDKDVEDGDGNMSKCFEVDSDLRLKYDFNPLKALIQTMDENDASGWDDTYFFDLEITMRTYWIIFEPFRDRSYRLFFDRNKAIDYAIDCEERFLDEEEDLSQLYDPNSPDVKERKKTVLEHYYDLFGSYIFDTKGVEDALRESLEFSYNDRSEDDAIDELLSNEVIEDTDEYFELDEDGEVDHSQPKFDYQDYCDKYVEKIMSQTDDVVEEYIFQLGVENAVNYVDTRKIAEKIIETDGPQGILAGGDGNEREERIGGNTYYIYRER